MELELQNDQVGLKYKTWAFFFFFLNDQVGLKYRT
jgi:hypothetical protein